MKFGVIVFPGSNCDHDCYHVLKHALGQECRFIWHKERDLGGVDAVVVPGGFAYGDYLRSGAIARFSPVMESVASFAAEGGYVLGGNGVGNTPSGGEVGHELGVGVGLGPTDEVVQVGGVNLDA